VKKVINWVIFDSLNQTDVRSVNAIPSRTPGFIDRWKELMHSVFVGLLCLNDRICMGGVRRVLLCISIAYKSIPRYSDFRIVKGSGVMYSICAGALWFTTKSIFLTGKNRFVGEGLFANSLCVNGPATDSLGDQEGIFL